MVLPAIHRHSLSCLFHTFSGRISLVKLFIMLRHLLLRVTHKQARPLLQLNLQREIHSRNKKTMELIAKGWNVYMKLMESLILLNLQAHVSIFNSELLIFTVELLYWQKLHGWHNHLNSNINKEAWSQEEEVTFIHAHQIYGNKRAELTEFLTGRRDNMIKNHWNSSEKKILDSYLASSLLAQFQGLPQVGNPNQSPFFFESTK
ncbi:hypothetical protein C5167_043581 [Papaver somniferum]|uniref:Uncharacterized protein n=1 Tax=Papaver somniferum TaxID=3469 RepID=A0A4Y7L958_PAPSO|nr:hypothetical protein C5167_043581 [Papaver somniferum]